MSPTPPPMSDRPPQITPQILPPISDPSIHAQIARLAQSRQQAGGPLIRLISRIGQGAENATTRLPPGLSRRLEAATEQALTRAFRAARASRTTLRPRSDRFNRIGATLIGGAAGAAGITGALLELPVTVTLLMRAILDIADEHGLDPEDEDLRREALRILAARPPSRDPARTPLSGLAIPLAGQSSQALIAAAAPRLAAMLGQKLALQSAPVIGAVAGATINHAFLGYYQNLARVHFGLLRLSRETGLPPEALDEAFLAAHRA